MEAIDPQVQQEGQALSKVFGQDMVKGYFNVAQAQANDMAPSIPVSSPVMGAAPASDPSSVQTVSQAYLAALAAMGTNTSGDTAPYVLMPPGAGTSSGGGISLGLVAVLAALALGVWWFMHRRKGA